MSVKDQGLQCNCKIKYIKQSYSQPWKKLPFALLCNSQCLQILRIHVLLTAQMSHWNISQLHLPLESCCTNKRNFYRFAIRSWTSVARSLCYSWATCFLLLDHCSGTACMKTSGLLRHWQFFADNWNFSYFGSHTLTLFCSCIAIVDLEVTLLKPWFHVKIKLF